MINVNHLDGKSQFYLSLIQKVELRKEKSERRDINIDIDEEKAAHQHLKSK